ncbi:unnamed protein product, partial [Vitis vinifera]|uniref:Uncharacterized protein n=1 Tax=Vitis vinifera TaxID=29760 RepID=D7T7T4_VITVI
MWKGKAEVKVKIKKKKMSGSKPRGNSRRTHHLLVSSCKANSTSIAFPAPSHLFEPFILYFPWNVRFLRF